MFLQHIKRIVTFFRQNRMSQLLALLFNPNTLCTKIDAIHTAFRFDNMSLLRRRNHLGLLSPNLEIADTCSVEMIQFLQELNLFTESHARHCFLHVCQLGHLDVVKFLVDRFQLTADDVLYIDNRAMRLSATHGQSHVVKYLVDDSQLTPDDVRPDDNRALREAAANGHLGTVKYLVDRFPLTPDDARADDNRALRWSEESVHINI
jgi:hypothetical protein